MPPTLRSITMEGRTSHSPAPGPQFFSDHRRGEVNELRQLLRLVQSERTDTQKQRDTIKKVIAFMTLGIDVSRLFSEMIMACCTSDIVQKKMIYLYLTTYAETNPDLALLAVNTLFKDSNDDDPAIRGLALRSLCSLRSANMLEYVEPAVRRGLTDRSGYVRRTAAIGVLKLWHLNPALVDGRQINTSTEEGVNELLMTQPNVETDHLINILFAMLNDVDSQVVANVISVLNEVLASDGGLPFTKKIAANLLNRIRQFNEWGQCAILNLVANYVPETDEELYDILNILEERIKHSSSAVVLSAARCFVDLTAGYRELREPMFLRLKAPFLTLIATAPPEIAYVVLTHLQHLFSLFEDENHDNESHNDNEPFTVRAMASDYKLFFCAFSDPVYIKLVKLDILSCIISQATAFSILNELSEYVVTDIDPSVVRKSIEVMGQIGAKYLTMAEHVIDQLLSFMELDVEFISAPGLVVIRNLLRHSPQLFSRVKEPLQHLFRTLTNPESVSAALWIFGQFGDKIEDAPYLLEDFIDNKVVNKSETQDAMKSSKDHNNSKSLGYRSSLGSQGLVLIELLTSCVKLLLARAPEMQKVLGKLFNLILGDDAVDFDVRDRTLHFYRFLMEAKTMGSQHTIKLLKNVLMEEPLDEQAVNFFEEVEAKTFSKTLLEFNTLSLLFKQPTDKFIVLRNPINMSGRFIPSSELINREIHNDKSAHHGKIKLPRRPLKHCSAEQEWNVNCITIESSNDLNDGGLMETPNELTQTASSSLLEGDDILIPPTYLSPSSSPQSPLPPSRAPSQSFISSDEFELLWTKLPIGAQKMIPLSLAANCSPQYFLRKIPEAISAQKLYCVASGIPTPDTVKFFFYGNPLKTSPHCLTELTIERQSCYLTVKSDQYPDLTSSEVLQFFTTRSAMSQLFAK